MVDHATMKHNAQHELDDLMAWLRNNDYHAVKRLVGEYDDYTPAWLAYKAERAQIVARVRELETILAL